MNTTGPREMENWVTDSGNGVPLAGRGAINWIYDAMSIRIL